MNDFSRHDLDILKAQVDLAALMRQAGIDLKPVGKNLKACCPWHEDKTPSLVLNPAKGLYNCFGCRAKGDVLDFIQRQESLSFAQAVARLRELAGASPVPQEASEAPRDPDRFAGGLTRPQLLELVAVHYKKALSASPKAHAYLEARGFEDKDLWEAFGLGFCDGTLLHTVPKTGETRQALIDLGVLNDKGREHFLDCVVVPLEHPEQGIVGLYGRRISKQARVKHLYLPGPKRGVFNWQVLQTASSVYLCEGVFDALSLWAVGVRNVSCLYGSGSMPADLERFLRASNVRELRLCLDEDRAGLEASDRLAAELGDRFEVSRVMLPDAQDPNAVLAGEGPGILREFLNCLKPLTPGPDVNGGAATDGREIPLCETHRDGFTLTFDDVTYEVEPRPPFTGRLAVAIKAQRTDGAGRKFRDRLDLVAARARSETVRVMSQSLALTKERAECHLMEILDVTEAWVQSAGALSDGEDKAAAPVLTEAQKLEALQFLQSPNLKDQILADTEELGYVGEEVGKLLIYLVGVSRKLQSPMSAIIRSQSGAGKSGLASLGVMLVPPEEVVHYSRVTAQALAYAEKTAYTHKLLVMEERVGGESADYYIRIMQSGHVIRQAVTIKDPATGKMKLQEVEVEGPIAYIETTTASVLNAENTSRCFEVYLDESEAQTSRIHQRQRHAKGLTRMRQADRQRILDKHHNAQRLLEKIPVVIPYAGHLTFPTKWLRTRRDNERFLCLIEASAFLHQYQRPRKTACTPEGEVAYIEATLDDYRIAYDLAKVVLKASLHELSPVARELFDQVAGIEGEFTRREVRELTGWSQRRVMDALNELEGMEYVARTAGSNGLTMRYSVLPSNGPASSGSAPMKHILHPDELRKILEAKR
jgi:DNA primase catalytic core